MHKIIQNGRILSPENGFLLGNGDLSVSVYQSETEVIWRFGKGNVWDRRLDLSDDPKPAHIDEVKRGILEEGWQVGAYVGSGKPVALKGTKDQKRMEEICQGTPESYETRPYPCPKPVGELALHLPPDLTGIEVSQTLFIEDGAIEITCRQGDIFALTARCWVDSEENILLIDWKIQAEPAAFYGADSLIWFSLYRWADPRVEVFSASQYAGFRAGLVCGDRNPAKASPLPPPTVEEDHGLLCIRQDFYPDKTFPEGSCCLVAPLCGGKAQLPAKTLPDTAAIHLLTGSLSGQLAVGVSATGDPYGDREGIHRLASLARQPGFFEESSRRLQKKMAEFWGKSAFRCGEEALERLWYETLYAFRCIYRGGTTPPGLFFPSSLKDYGHWHGDYHSNYNFQQPFFGIGEANHPEGLDAYFDGMEYFLRIGRKIARDYYNCRGAFIQLTAYPMEMEDDPIGVVPMGRMAYMTGWAVSAYWRRYLLTMDKEWLEKVGYPAIRDCALFYADFLTMGEDGKYHAFPSNQGEDGFSGNPADFADKPQVADCLCYCLRCAINAANALGKDPDLAALWEERLTGYAADRAAQYPEGSLERRRNEELSPEYAPSCCPLSYEQAHNWYFGHYIINAVKSLRGLYDGIESPYSSFLEEIRRWRHPNGLCWAMAASRYGQIGGWTETLGVLSVVMEMALQSWDGCLRFFPGLPPEVDFSFENFRARGAFLVSASREKGEITRLEIFSEKGGACTFMSPWDSVRVLDGEGKEIPCKQGPWGSMVFETEAGKGYRLAKGR